MLFFLSFMNFAMSVSFWKLFKLPLEKEGQVGGPILAQEEIKTIFGSIPDIYDVHTRIKVLSVRVLCCSVCSLLSSFHCWVSLKPGWPGGAPVRLVRGPKRGQHHSQICEFKLWNRQHHSYCGQSSMTSVVLPHGRNVILWICLHSTHSLYSDLWAINDLFAETQK